MSIANRVKDAGLGILGLAAVVGILAIGTALLVGLAEFSVWVLEWTVPAFLVTLLISLVLLAFSLIPPVRGFCAIGIMYASFVLGAVLWIWGLSYTYIVWGLLGVMVGLMFLGVGVVPVAMVAALVNADWGNLGFFFVAVVLTFGSRGLAHWLGEKADERMARLSRADIDVAAYEIRD
jgi:hypothetical protein